MGSVADVVAVVAAPVVVVVAGIGAVEQVAVGIGAVAAVVVAADSIVSHLPLEQEPQLVAGPLAAASLEVEHQLVVLAAVHSAFL